jgi:glycosyltransferase involved in cell wall biosynthesis
MRVNLASVRAEFETSGERQSTLVIKENLEKLGAVVDEAVGSTEPGHGRIPTLRNLADFAQLSLIARRMRDDSYDWHFIKLPTVAQLPLLDFLARKVQHKLVVVLDSVCAGRQNSGSMMRELRHEPLLAVGKRIANHPVWARLSGLRPRAIICCAQTQRQEAIELLGPERSSYWVIPNASLPTVSPQPWRPHPPGSVVVGYLGHPFAHKGVLEVIEAARLLPASLQCEFRAAFSFSGRSGVRRVWLEGGGKNVQVVEVAHFLNSIDVLCVPLYTEFGTKVFPNVLLEAMRAGVPLITTRSEVARELFGDDSAVGWVDKVSPGAIAGAITDLLRQDLIIVSGRLRGRYQQFNQDVIQNKWRQCISFLIEKP